MGGWLGEKGTEGGRGGQSGKEEEDTDGRRDGCERGLNISLTWDFAHGIGRNVIGTDKTLDMFSLTKSEERTLRAV